MSTERNLELYIFTARIHKNSTLSKKANGTENGKVSFHGNSSSVDNLFL